LSYYNVLAEELTAEQRAIADALVGKQIKEIQAEAIKSTELHKNINVLSKREKTFEVWGGLMDQIGSCVAKCRESHIPIPKDINDSVVDDIIWQYENTPLEGSSLSDYRKRCIKLLSVIGNKKAIPTIVISLERETWDSEWPPLEVIADERLIPPIEIYQAWRHSQSYAIPAVKCLGEIGPKSIPILKQFLKENDLAIQRETIDALVKICSPQCIPVLFEEVITGNNHEFAMKAQAGILLIRCRTIDKIYSRPKWNPEDDARLCYLTNLVLSDMDPNVRFEATEATLKIGEPTVWHLRLGLPNRAHAMRGSIEEPFYFVAERASDILSRIGDPAIPALIDALCDEYVYPQNRRFAGQALQKITGQTFEPDYEKWKSWYLQKYRKKNTQQNTPADVNTI
jgi:HEAT repeat protein